MTAQARAARRLIDPGVSLPLEPDVIIPAQIGRSSYRSPEQRLWAAILQTALDDLGGGRSGQSPRRPGQIHEAYSWVLEDDRSWIFSFRSLCEMLGLDADAVRGAIVYRMQHLTK